MRRKTFWIFLLFPLGIAAQVITSIPEAPVRLNAFYVSSQQGDVKAKLSAPAAMAVARSGNIYVFDDGNSRIVKLSPSGKFLGEFGQPGSGPGAVERADLNDSIAVDQNENVYIGDPGGAPRIEIFDAKGAFLRSFRSPFPMTSIAVNRKHEIFVAMDTAQDAQLIYVFSETGKFLRRFGERLVKARGRAARAINQAVITCDPQDNLYVAFRSWPVIRKYSPNGILAAETQFQIPAELVKDAQRSSYSLEFFAAHADSSFVAPLITHSIAIDGTGTGYLLLNAHSVVVFSTRGQVIRQFHFRAPRDRSNVFLRLAGSANSTSVYFLDTRSGEIYETQKL